MQNICRDLVSVLFFDMSATGGYMGAKYVQEVGPICLAGHALNVACHGVSISIVSISSCRVMSTFCVSACLCHVAATLDDGTPQ